MKESYRIIIDTNLWISFLLTKKFSFIDKLLSQNKVQLLFCRELLDELMEVIERPKLQKFFKSNDKKIILDLIARYADYVAVTSNVTVCRDEKDNFLLSLAKDSKANFLITGDKDLLVIKRFENTEIVTIAEYEMIVDDI
jgi:putative PIN family toxin of toxin-antitoxin system